MESQAHHHNTRVYAVQSSVVCRGPLLVAERSCPTISSRDWHSLPTSFGVSGRAKQRTSTREGSPSQKQIKTEDVLKNSYTACYCEENIYHLASQLDSSGLYVIVISNADKSVPFWLNKAQITQANPQGFIVWDYHVILLALSDKTIYDYDSDVSFPCSVDVYLRTVLRRDESDMFLPRFRRLYRVIKASDYLQEFASDRSHMLIDGRYIAAPPPSPCIVAKNGTQMNLNELLTMASGKAQRDIDIRPGLLGTVLDEPAFCSWLSDWS